MSFDYSRLRGRIKEVCGTQEEFARIIGIGTVSLSKRLNNQLQFSQREMANACSALKIPMGEASAYFFAEKVQKSEQQ